MTFEEHPLIHKLGLLNMGLAFSRKGSNGGVVSGKA